MDQKIGIPEDMRKTLLGANHYDHERRDTMLRVVSDVWWPRVHREIVDKAQKRPDCQKAGNNLKRMKSQREFGKLPERNYPNEEISIDLADPFQNAHEHKSIFLSR